MRKPKVFLDSSVIISALLSSRGGSFWILNELRSKCFFQINEYGLAEMRAILETKFAHEPRLATELFLLLGLAEVQTLPDPSRSDVRKAAKFISKNDAPILASALASSEYLLTLDKEFLKPFIMEMAKKRELSIRTPGDFISTKPW